MTARSIAIVERHGAGTQRPAQQTPAPPPTPQRDARALLRELERDSEGASR